jgi:hypothetical protein
MKKNGKQKEEKERKKCRNGRARDNWVEWS